MEIVYGKNKTDYIIKKQCKFCRKTFIAPCKQTKYCSEECRTNFYKQKCKKDFYKDETLCWNCGNATGGCSWSGEFIPVEGWKAKPTKIKHSGKYSDRSFHVIKCPEFDRDQRKVASRNDR